MCCHLFLVSEFLSVSKRSHPLMEDIGGKYSTFARWDVKFSTLITDVNLVIPLIFFGSCIDPFSAREFLLQHFWKGFENHFSMRHNGIKIPSSQGMRESKIQIIRQISLIWEDVEEQRQKHQKSSMSVDEMYSNEKKAATIQRHPS